MICVSIGKISYPDLLVLLNNEQLVEIRLDLNNFSDDEIRAIFSSKAETIATCRPGTFTETERIEKLKICIEAGASYADLELETGEEYLKELSTLSGENGCKLIISCHDHEKTPSISELKKYMNHARRKEQILSRSHVILSQKVIMPDCCHFTILRIFLKKSR